MTSKLKITRQDGTVRYLRVFGHKDLETQRTRLSKDPKVQSVRVLSIPASR